ncbi:MAG: hypothetical protein CM15mP4_0250 [Candidatus Neomarinimicrobiota bacterium]|nr:MAG: hypothetical protein CM15mP4_0250 [Candidatus Neomarinimicrobiota bacterium]
MVFLKLRGFTNVSLHLKGVQLKSFFSYCCICSTPTPLQQYPPLNGLAGPPGLRNKILKFVKYKRSLFKGVPTENELKKIFFGVG